MERNYINIFSGLFFLVFSIVIFIQVNNIEALTDDLIGSDFLPRIVSILIALTGISIFVNGVLNKKKYSEGNKTTANEQENDVKEKKDHLLVIYSMVLMLLYVMLVSTIGFLITTSSYMFVQMLLFSSINKKNILTYLIISIVATLIIYYVFRNVFYVMIPAGVLG